MLSWQLPQTKCPHLLCESWPCTEEIFYTSSLIYPTHNSRSASQHSLLYVVAVRYCCKEPSSAIFITALQIRPLDLTLLDWKLHLIQHLLIHYFTSLTITADFCRALCKVPPAAGKKEDTIGLHSPSTIRAQTFLPAEPGSLHQPQLFPFTYRAWSLRLLNFMQFLLVHPTFLKIPLEF